MTALYTFDVFSTLDGYGSYGPGGDWGGYWGKQGPERVPQGVGRTEQGESPSQMVNESSNACTLISASCTTGWLDWIHGELWLCPNGLLRRSLGLLATTQHSVPVLSGVGTIDQRERPIRTFSDSELASIGAADRRNSWIRWHDIAAATLKRGIIDHSLHLRLRDGRRAKFLWLKSDGGFALLNDRLTAELGNRLFVVTRPIG